MLTIHTDRVSHALFSAKFGIDQFSDTHLTDGDNEDSAANGEVTQIFSQEWLTDCRTSAIRRKTTAS